MQQDRAIEQVMQETGMGKLQAARRLRELADVRRNRGARRLPHVGMLK